MHTNAEPEKFSFFHPIIIYSLFREKGAPISDFSVFQNARSLTAASDPTQKAARETFDLVVKFSLCLLFIPPAFILPLFFDAKMQKCLFFFGKFAETFENLLPKR